MALLIFFFFFFSFLFVFSLPFFLSYRRLRCGFGGACIISCIFVYRWRVHDGENDDMT
ncbi:hypothetical protein BZA77DRAFT_299556 [Pyronema omphalodes]|nr:hypothetical protein BZA77DRAFT_299556 [Pyronema omphalodes]